MRARTRHRLRAPPRLGTPADIRWFYKHHQVAEGAARFDADVERRPREELDALAAELAADAPATALLCLEADPGSATAASSPSTCATRLPGLQVIRPVGLRRAAEARGQRRDEVLEGRVEVELDAEAAGGLQRREAMDGRAEAAQRVEGLLLVERPAAQDAAHDVQDGRARRRCSWSSGGGAVIAPAA